MVKRLLLGGVVCLTLCLPSRPVAAADPATQAGPDYASAMREAQVQLRGGLAPTAEATLRALLQMYPGNADVQFMLGLALEAQDKLAESAALLQPLTDGHPDNPEIRQASARVSAKLGLAEAGRLRDAGQLVAALLEARKVYESGLNVYDAGLLVARLQSAQRLHIEAARTYGALASRYPQDAELPALQVRALVDAREREAARDLYDSLSPAVQSVARRALGDTLAGLYSNDITLWGSSASSTRGYPNDSASGVQVAQRVRRGTLTLQAEQHRRFGSNAQQYGAGFEFPLRSPWGAYLGFTASPQRSFLAGTRLMATVNYWWSRSVGYLSVQSLDFSNSHAIVLAPGATWFATDRWSVDSRVYWVNSTGSYSVMLAPQWVDERGNRVRLTLVAGQAGENLGISGGILRTPSQSVRVDATWRVSDRLGLDAAVFHEHRAELYDRSGLTLGLAAWW